MSLITKEIVFFLGVALMCSFMLLDSCGAPTVGTLTSSQEDLAGEIDQDAVQSALAKVKERDQQNKLKGFLSENFSLSPGARHGDSASEFDKPDLAAALPETFERRTKQLFFGRSELEPMGRISLPPPSTPGISVARGFAPSGPDYPFVRDREPLPLLTPESGYTPPDSGDGDADPPPGDGDGDNDPPDESDDF